MRALITFGLLAFYGAGHSTFSQTIYRKSPTGITLDNGYVSREINWSGDSVRTLSLTLPGVDGGFVVPSPEFALEIDDVTYNGFSGWAVVAVDSISDASGGRGVRLLLRPSGKTAMPAVELALHYLLYPELPLIRKWLSVTNSSAAETLRLEAVDVEALYTTLEHTSAVVHHDYARMKHLGRFVGDWHDPVAVVHDVTGRRGLALGNEAMAVLKRTAYHDEADVSNAVRVGLTHDGDDFPFREYLIPGETWVSPRTFVIPYRDRDDGFAVVDDEVHRYTVLHLGTRLAGLPDKPIFVYNTWYPFRTMISDTLVRSVARAAADCGITEFVIDDGWQVNAHGRTSTRGWGENYGDWLVDETKFPQGLGPTFEYIKSLGMKPGLWVSIASATADAEVFQRHPEWFVEDSTGAPGNLHYAAAADDGFYTASFGTAWRSYIRDKIMDLVDDYGLEYAKLDLAVVTSPYVNDDRISGSYARTHPGYTDHRESFGVLYDNVLGLFDELHARAPELFIDCTFETAGKLQLMDYAIARHAEGNWLANFEEPSPVGALRVRQMAWWRSPALPAASLVIGNLPLDDPGFLFGLKSLVGTLPIVLGDPREVQATERAVLRKWSTWMQAQQDLHDYMLYRRDLAGFGEPREGHWDGWQRMNFKTRAGGVFGVFRQGALEQTRRVFLKDLDPDRSYIVTRAPDDTLVVRATGRSLMEQGLAVTIGEHYGGEVFAVSVE